MLQHGGFSFRRCIVSRRLLSGTALIFPENGFGVTGSSLRSRVITGDCFVPVTRLCMNFAQEKTCCQSICHGIKTCFNRRKCIGMPAEIDLETSDIDMWPRTESTRFQHCFYGIDRQFLTGKGNSQSVYIDSKGLVIAFNPRNRNKQTLRNIQAVLHNSRCLVARDILRGLCLGRRKPHDKASYNKPISKKLVHKTNIEWVL